MAMGAMAAGLALLVWSGEASGLHLKWLGDWVLDRLDLYRQTLTLVRDYPFTGSGLGCFTMVYSTYLLLINVRFISLVGNAFLQIAVEQGIVGLVAFVWLLGAFFWTVARARAEETDPESQIVDDPQQSSAVSQAARWAVVVILVHALVQGTLYASWTLPLLFVPVGLAVATTPGSPTLGPRSRLPTADYVLPTSRLRRRWVVTGLLVVMNLVAVALIWRGPLLSLLFSNLGAVHQTRAELSVYEWPAWPIQDAVRREVDLSRPMGELQRALTYDPGNATANRRLGMMEVSLGKYEEALAHLERAYAAEPSSPTTRQLLGEAFTVNGQLEAGRALWSAVTNDQGQLGLRAWWYKHIGDVERAEWVWQAVDSHGE